MRATMARAVQIALARGHNYLGTEHMILALLDDPHGIAGGVIHRLGYAEAIHGEVVRILETEGYARPSREIRP